MKSSVLWALIVIGSVYVGFCAYLFAAQRSFIYFPVGASDNVPAEDVRLESGDQTLQIWRLSAGKPKAIIYFGGNAENVAFNIPLFIDIFPDYTLYLVNYRGYGASTGAPTEAALYADALQIYAHVRDNHDSVSVIGRSLGSGVATYVAVNRPIERLALVTAFDSVVRIAQSSFPIFPVSWLLRDRFDSVGRAHEIAAPTLILIAGRDEFIPARNAKALAAKIDPGLLSLEIIDDAGHNTISEFATYAQALGDFF